MRQYPSISVTVEGPLHIILYHRYDEMELFLVIRNTDFSPCWYLHTKKAKDYSNVCTLMFQTRVFNKHLLDPSLLSHVMI